MACRARTPRLFGLLFALLIATYEYNAASHHVAGTLRVVDGRTGHALWGLAAD